MRRRSFTSAVVLGCILLSPVRMVYATTQPALTTLVRSVLDDNPRALATRSALDAAQAGDLGQVALDLARLADTEANLQLARLRGVHAEAEQALTAIADAGLNGWPALPDIPSSTRFDTAKIDTLLEQLPTLRTARRFELGREAWGDWLQTGQTSLESQTQLLERLWQAGELSTAGYLVQIKQTLDTRIAAAELRGNLWQVWFEWLAASDKTASWLGLKD